MVCLQSFKSHGRHRRFAAVFIALCLAIGLAIYAPPLAAQSSPASPTSGDAQQRLAQQQGDADTAILDWVLANSGRSQR